MKYEFECGVLVVMVKVLFFGTCWISCELDQAFRRASNVRSSATRDSLALDPG
jgi:hypothetical protein